MNESKGKINIILLLLCILPVFALDKLYVGGKKEWKIWLIKVVSQICLVGFVWWVYDIVTCAQDKYKLNPLKQ